MKCEMYLARKNNLPYTILRLPDVIGAYDSSDRFWATMRWMENNPVKVSREDEVDALSWVDNVSVAGQIVKIMGMEYVPSRVYNLSSV